MELPFKNLTWKGDKARAWGGDCSCQGSSTPQIPDWVIDLYSVTEVCRNPVSPLQPLHRYTTHSVSSLKCISFFKKCSQSDCRQVHQRIVSALFVSLLEGMWTGLKSNRGTDGQQQAHEAETHRTTRSQTRLKHDAANVHKSVSASVRGWTTEMIRLWEQEALV